MIFFRKRRWWQLIISVIAFGVAVYPLSARGMLERLNTFPKEQFVVPGREERAVTFTRTTMAIVVKGREEDISIKSASVGKPMWEAIQDHAANKVLVINLFATQGASGNEFSPPLIVHLRYDEQTVGSLTGGNEGELRLFVWHSNANKWVSNEDTEALRNLGVDILNYRIDAERDTILFEIERWPEDGAIIAFGGRTAR